MTLARRYVYVTKKPLPRADWQGRGRLEPQQSDDGPAYAGKLVVDGDTHHVELFSIRDGRGYECLSFSPRDTKAGVLWPTREKLHEESPDLFGVVVLEGRRWRVRAWRAAGDVLRCRVKQ